MRATADDYIKTGRVTALISFIFGTLILVLYAISLDYGMIGFGLMFIFLAGILNTIVLLSLLIKAIKDAANRKKLLLTSGLMLLNIPVMILYIFISGHFANIIRLHVNNSTKTEITDIHITGCQDKYINKLQPGASNNVKIDIPGDCSLNIDYLQNGVRKKEVIADYVTNDNGQSMTYNIGGDNDPF